MLVFKKQVDNLKTNHRGVYVLTDNVFRPLSRMSTDAGGQAVARAQPVCLLTAPSTYSLLYSAFG
jgi:trafficking protein particle complex subunit 6